MCWRLLDVLPLSHHDRDDSVVIHLAVWILYFADNTFLDNETCPLALGYASLYQSNLLSVWDVK